MQARADQRQASSIAQPVMSYPEGSVLSRSVLPTVAFLGLGFTLLAQYAVDWAVLSNGSGTSSADGYVLEGTIGQAITGSQTGGAYTLTAGFWSLVTLVPTSDAPVLRVAWNVNGSGPKIMWAKTTEGWVLHQTDALAGSETEWVPVDGPYLDTGTALEVIIAAPLGQSFFRLQK